MSGKRMKAYLLRVGIDLGYGALGPIFEDNTFEFIPISERSPSREPRTYSTMNGHHGGVLADYLPRKLQQCPPHFDPEFSSNTYGDPSGKAKQLRKLQKGDLLVFYAGLQPWRHQRELKKGLYLIGFFCVDRVFDFQSIPKREQPTYRTLLRENAHMKRIHPAWEDLVIVQGSEESFLLDRAVLISRDGVDRRGRRLSVASNQFEQLTGVKGSLQRSQPPRWIRQTKHVKNLWKLLEEDAISL